MRLRSVLGLMSVGLLCLGCATSEKYDMRQEIEMGPFVFRVTGAYSEKPATGHPKIIVNFSVRYDTNASFEFAEYFNDDVDSEGNPTHNRQSVLPRISHPRMKVVDSHGHGFIGLVKGESGEFIVWGLKLRDQEKFDEKHADLEPEDFRLLITNPYPREGQPSRVSIQLR